MTSGGTTNLTAPSSNFLLVSLTSLIAAGGGLTPKKMDASKM